MKQVFFSFRPLFVNKKFQFIWNLIELNAVPRLRNTSAHFVPMIVPIDYIVLIAHYELH